MFGQGLLRQGVQAARLLVLFNLGIPLGLGSLVEPGTDLRHLLRRQLGDGGGNRFDGGHRHSSTEPVSIEFEQNTRRTQLPLEPPNDTRSARRPRGVERVEEYRLRGRRRQPRSKLAQAQQLGIPIRTEAEFEAILASKR